jgi:hypothetical protein
MLHKSAAFYGVVLTTRSLSQKYIIVIEQLLVKVCPNKMKVKDSE